MPSRGIQEQKYRTDKRKTVIDLSADFLQCVESARGDVLQSVEKLRAVSTVRGVLI